MIHLVVLLVFVLAGGYLEASQNPEGSQAATECADWQTCQQRTKDALAEGAYESAHDLAWRTVQKGPKNAPELLYLLARAQSLSGRANDALVMLGRLAETGVAAGAVTDEDFSRVRERPGWPDIEARLTGNAAAAPELAPAATPAPTAAKEPPPSKPARGRRAVPAPKPAASETPAVVPPPASPDVAAPIGEAPITPVAPMAVAQEAARFMTQRFAAGGLAYDAVSGRFVFGDLYGRKLIIAQDGVDHAVDFVRSESAGFYQVMSLTIDVPRGDLWVVSAEGEGGAAAVHKVQLISGRPLKKYDVPADLEPVKLVDVAVTPAGAVIALDAVGGHILRLLPRAEQMHSILKVKAEAPTSIAMGRDEQIAYVAHAAGLSRIDLVSHRVTALSAPKNVELGGFERIRWHRDALIGIQRTADGARRVVRLQLNAAGRAIASATVIQESMPQGQGPVFATVSDDQFSYLVGGANAVSDGDPAERAEVIVYRIALR
jgi:hypothetical protein